MTNSFNLDRYRELNEKETAFNNQGKSLLYQAQPEFWELLGYQATVERQMIYNRKNDYFLLLDKYINHLITFFEFQSEFSKMEKEDSSKAAKILHDYEQLSVLSIADNLKEFDKFIHKISQLCFAVNEVGGPSKEEFYSSMKNLYFQLQKYLYHLTEKFEAKATKSLAEDSLKNPKLKAEYENLQKKLKRNTKPYDIGRNSCIIKDKIVIVKLTHGRYLVELDGDDVTIIGISTHGTKKTFKKLMNENYSTELKY